MSVSFFPKPSVDESTPADKLIWGSYFFSNPGFDRFLSNEQRAVFESYGGDPGYYYWEQGDQPISYWLEEAEKLGMALEDDHSHSKLFVRRSGPDVLYGVRISGQPPEDIGKEMSIAQGNAEVFLGMMGLDIAGCMNPVAFLKSLEQLSSRRDLTEFTAPVTDNGNDPERLGPRIIDYGMPMERIQGYIMGLERICDHCIRYERDICWG